MFVENAPMFYVDIGAFFLKELVIIMEFICFFA